MHLSRFLEPAAVGRGSGLEARNSIDKVADRIHRRVAGANAEFTTIVNDGGLRPACVRLREIESKHIGANVGKDFIRRGRKRREFQPGGILSQIEMLRQLKLCPAKSC